MSGMFVHTADVHLGFQKKEGLVRLERAIFDNMMDWCVKQEVDFILMAGDLFHTNIPNMDVQKHAFAAFDRVRAAGIPVYAVYGSHDASPIHGSVIDLLAEGGFLKNVHEPEKLDDDRIRLGFTTDPKTGIKIAGLPGLKVGREEAYFRMLDKEALEAEPGPKIFMFHGGFTDLVEGHKGDSMPISLLPTGFDYYAGGHIHETIRSKYGDAPIVYPGPLFAGYHADMELTASGMRRGHMIVRHENGKVTDVAGSASRPDVQYRVLNVDASNRKSEDVDKEVRYKSAGADVDGKVILMKVAGTISEGRTSDIDLAGAITMLNARGAIAVELNRRGLLSKKYEIEKVEQKGSRKDLARAIFDKNIKEYEGRPALMGDSGVDFAMAMFKTLSQEKREGETKADYEKRVIDPALKMVLEHGKETA